ncbi:hypothetical protein [uncultured Nocardioides sp.]|uniref:hypothetical protein n=1 Tax=uncultured Nocardioides sp. TaxID=198441 RepID=UPI002605945D|nr:hypothetical protein [uncultured Nocardioides sp.]
MTPPRPRSRRGVPADLPDAVRATERWFIAQGLPYFVPEQRAAARAALRSRRSLVVLVLVAAVSLAVGVLLARVTDDPATAPALLTLVVGGSLAVYGVTAMRGAPVARFALRRTVTGLRLLVPLVTRALPLLLLAITFLFINAEVWEVSATLDGGRLWLVVLLFASFAVLFLLVRLPDELDAADHGVSDEGLVGACRGTPLAAHAERVVADHPASDLTDVRRFERANLVLVLVIVQAAQVLLVALAVFAFLMLLGGVAMDESVQSGWIGEQRTTSLPVLGNLSVELAQVSTFLAAFAGLSFTVYAVTDETYRDQFFTQVKGELDRAVGVRAVYLAARQEVGEPAADSDAAGPR